MVDALKGDPRELAKLPNGQAMVVLEVQKQYHQIID
jgi:hypothetical protein